MSAQSKALLVLSLKLTGTVVANRFVTQAGAQAGAGVNAFGVARVAGVSGDQISVDVVGTTVVEAGAAMSAGDLVEIDASGRAITRNAGAIQGRLLPGQVPAQAGDLVEMLLFPN